MSRLLKIAASATLLLLATFADPANAEPKLVVEDNDYFGPAGSDMQSALILLANPGAVKVQGFTVVTGDAWRDEETQMLLRFLEIAGAADKPVFPGSVSPLINNKARMTAWEAAYGKIPWKGAFNDPGYPPGGWHPNDPYKIMVNPAGTPKAKPQAENGIAYMIRMVHEHPHQVTAGVQAERPGYSRQFHAGFIGGAIPLAVVAGMTAGNQILPSRLAGSGARDDVIQGQLTGGKRPMAILTRISIAHQDVLARESARLVRDPPILQQSDHRGQAHGGSRRVDRAQGFLLRRGDALQHQHQGTPRRADIDRFVAGVEHQDGSLQSFARHQESSPTLETAAAARVTSRRRSTRATVRSATLAAPARLRAEAHEDAVEPVVITSSIRRTRFPWILRPP